jgi:hypothetical protein
LVGAAISGGLERCRKYHQPVIAKIAPAPMSDVAVIVLIFGGLIALAFVWWYFQTRQLKKFRKYLLNTGWRMGELDLFRVPKDGFLREVDKYIRQNGEEDAKQAPLLIAMKEVANQIFVTEVNSISTPAPVWGLGLNLYLASDAGAYSMNILVTSQHKGIQKVSTKEAVKVLENDHMGTRIISRKVNFPHRWIRVHAAMLEVSLNHGMKIDDHETH